MTKRLRVLLVENDDSVRRVVTRSRGGRVDP